jgi:ribonuclease-3
VADAQAGPRAEAGATAPLEMLDRTIGVDFHDPALREMALTHRSFAFERGLVVTNERLEFLGDSVLGLVVTDMAYREYPEMPEGSLAKLRAAVVNMTALADVARSLGLGDVVLLGKGEEQSGGRGKSSILADALEAIFGAVYLASGFDGARALVLRILGPKLATAPLDGADHKSRLQELAAHRFGAAPRYAVEATGPDHARTFFVTVSIADTPYGRGEGRSKKQAEQAAARAACDELAGATAAGGDTSRGTDHG